MGASRMPRYTGGMLAFFDLPAAILVAVLVILATLRLTRLATTDSLTGWLIREPLQRWGDRHEANRRAAILMTVEETDPDNLAPSARAWLSDLVSRLDQDDPVSWQARLVSGIYCPFCVGFWIAVAVTLITIVLAPLGVLFIVWEIVLIILSVNYVTAHISARLD